MERLDPPALCRGANTKPHGITLARHHRTVCGIELDSSAVVERDHTKALLAAERGDLPAQELLRLSGALGSLFVQLWPPREKTQTRQKATVGRDATGPVDCRRTRPMSGAAPRASTEWLAARPPTSARRRRWSG
jgi:hypothetical protein